MLQTLAGGSGGGSGGGGGVGGYANASVSGTKASSDSHRAFLHGALQNIEEEIGKAH